VQNPVIGSGAQGKWKLVRRPPPRHFGLFTTADNGKILPEPHGQRLSNPKIKKRRGKISAPFVLSNFA
jgi:hypothetical protein